MSENFLSKYVDEIYNQADILLPTIEENKFKQELNEELVYRIGEASIDMLDEESKKGYFEMLKKNPSNEEIRNYFVSNIEDFDNKINKEIVNFASSIILKIKKSIIMASVNIDKYSNNLEEESNESIEDVLLEQNNKNN